MCPWPSCRSYLYIGENALDAWVALAWSPGYRSTAVRWKLGNPVHLVWYLVVVSRFPNSTCETCEIVSLVSLSQLLDDLDVTFDHGLTLWEQVKNVHVCQTCVLPSASQSNYTPFAYNSSGNSSGECIHLLQEWLLQWHFCSPNPFLQLSAFLFFWTCDKGVGASA